MTTLDSRVIELVEQVMAWLVSGNFAAIERRSRGVRLSADMMRQAIADYGRTLITPPSEAFATMDVIRVADADRPAWSIRFDLWTKEEGRSDLSLECRIVDRCDGHALDLAVDDIHVL
ncbi:DUF7668 domain-containing protein [Bradyrhizobium aeschynomenes]|uniref:DUF7668 domain-containing protein n=1 Tax=Bradyrhizobium aeschynomenes TaxID=2734909 RepID=UPI001556E2C9|nr:hypothetical protein [Bradyrhizobium aeschynomenes]NPV19950.1 hypothetical protein [Bradyrhizobium aeschynomenes]